MTLVKSFVDSRGKPIPPGSLPPCVGMTTGPLSCVLFRHLLLTGCDRTVPVYFASEVHYCRDGQEAGDRPNKKSVIFQPQEQVNESVEQRKRDQRAHALDKAVKDPFGIDRKQQHGSTSAYQKTPIEPDALRHGE